MTICPPRSRRRRACARAGAITAALLAVTAAAAPLRAQSGGVYTVAKVSVDATAEDAVAAKRKAHARAKQEALRTVFKRLTPYSAYDQLPTAEADRIDDMLASYSLRSEQNSRTRYLATLDFEFSAPAVRDYLASYDIAWSDEQAAPVTLLPVYIADGAVVAGRTPWRRAWNDLDLAHAVTPVNPSAPGESLDAARIAEILAGETGAFDDLKRRHGSDSLVLAVAENAAGKERLEVKLYGIDAAGPLALARSERIEAGGPADAARRAARLSLGILERRWKLTQGVPDSAGEEAERHAVAVTVEFAGLGQWREIRDRLAEIPGVKGMEVASLSARSADVTFRFPGGAPDFAGKAPAHDMALSKDGDVWILRSN